MSVLEDRATLSVVVAVMVATYLFFWRNRKSPISNVNGPAAPSFATGNLLQMIDPETGRDFVLDIANEFGGVVKVKELFGTESLLVSDTLALHHILVKEPYVFDEWPAFTSTNSLLFGDGLVATIGEQHKRQRKMLNPVFSAKHLRNMTPTFWAIAKKLEGVLQRKVDNGGSEIDVTSWLTRTALELIGQSGIGHSFDDFSSDAVSPFVKAVKELAATVSLMVPAAPFTPFFKKMGPAWFRRVLVLCIPVPIFQRLREIVDIMAEKVETIFHSKKVELGEDQEDNKDIMSILLKANKRSNAQDRLSDEELVGQMATLIFTATDTTSGALARLLHILSQNPTAQDRLRAEIVTAYQDNNGHDLDYETLSNLPYLDAIVRETLRVYPPIPMVFRQTTKDAVIPLLNPVRGVDGQELREVHVAKGTHIFINIIGNNHSKDSWGVDASEWKPERWLAPLPQAVQDNRNISGVYSHLMTFIAGGRACIGFKFSQLEMKVVIATLIQSFVFGMPKDKDIGWNMGLLMTPVVKGSGSMHAHMPLVIRRTGQTNL